MENIIDYADELSWKYANTIHDLTRITVAVGAESVVVFVPPYVIDAVTEKFHALAEAPAVITAEGFSPA